MRPDFRGKSIGLELVNRVLKFAKSRGYAAAALDTLRSMTVARALYARLGFREVEPYYDNPVDGTSFMQLVSQAPAFRKSSGHTAYRVSPLSRPAACNTLTTFVNPIRSPHSNGP